jgi:hypothetical protein
MMCRYAWLHKAAVLSPCTVSCARQLTRPVLLFLQRFQRLRLLQRIQLPAVPLPRPVEKPQSLWQRVTLQRKELFAPRPTPADFLPGGSSADFSGRNIGGRSGPVTPTAGQQARKAVNRVREAALEARASVTESLRDGVSKLCAKAWRKASPYVRLCVHVLFLTHRFLSPTTAVVAKTLAVVLLLRTLSEIRGDVATGKRLLSKL